MVNALCKEIALRKEELKKPIETIYFGGGTPSLLEEKELHKIFEAIKTHFDIEAVTECTIECNPDDLTKEKLQTLIKFPFNRLSIGIQTFNEEVLSMLNRAHNSQEATKSIELAQQFGFTNITCDLIYGIPTISNEEFRKDVDTLLQFDIPHISAYCLTVEDKTALKKMIATNRIQAPIEEDAISQYDLLKEKLSEANFIQYEISNFSKEGQQAVHNTNYWNGKEYLGIGPSAHSYNTKQRSFNISNNAQYINALTQNKLPIEREELTVKDNINDYILTRLRTIWGIDIEELKTLYHHDLLESKNVEIFRYQAKKWLEVTDSSIKLSKEGSLMADEIAMELFEN